MMYLMQLLGEGYIQQHQDWQCNRAKAIKSALGDSHILITTGGESHSTSPSWHSHTDFNP